MANFKHNKPRASRSGCHYCKPHKAMGNHKDRTRPQYRLKALVVVE